MNPSYAEFYIVFKLNPLKVKFELGINKVNFRFCLKNIERCPDGAESRNNGQTFALSPPTTNNEHRKFDLNLRSMQR
jgi:hypothetical protein